MNTPKLHYATDPPFGLAQLRPRLADMHVGDVAFAEAAGARSALNLIAGLEPATAQAYGERTADAAVVDQALEGSDFHRGVTDGLIRHGEHNRWLNKELADSLGGDAYRLGLFAGASAIGDVLAIDLYYFGRSVEQAIVDEGTALRKGGANAYVQRDRRRVLGDAEKARDLDFRTGRTAEIVDEVAAEGTPGELYRALLGTLDYLIGDSVGRESSTQTFDEPLDERAPTLGERIAGTPPEVEGFVRKILDAMPSYQHQDLPPRHFYNLGVRRAVAFVAIAAADVADATQG